MPSSSYRSNLDASQEALGLIFNALARHVNLHAPWCNRAEDWDHGHATERWVELADGTKLVLEYTEVGARLDLEDWTEQELCLGFFIETID